MIILAELADSPSAHPQAIDIAASIAQIIGFPVYALPVNSSAPNSADALLSSIPSAPQETPGLWIGSRSGDRYAALYQAALHKNIRLLNTPDHHLRAQSFDRAYAYLQGLTPESLVIPTLENFETVIHAMQQADAPLSFPVFVRGSQRSHQQQGWPACVADSPSQLKQLAIQLFQDSEAAPQGILVRQLLKLQAHRTLPNGFPLAREFRLWVYKQTILTYGYYWPIDNPLKWLTVEEEEAMFAVAIEAAQRLNVPFLAIDMAQLQDGRWIVIDTGDAQCTWMPQLPFPQLWLELEQIVLAHGL